MQQRPLRRFTSASLVLASVLLGGAAEPSLTAATDAVTEAWRRPAAAQAWQHLRIRPSPRRLEEEEEAELAKSPGEQAKVSSGNHTVDCNSEEMTDSEACATFRAINKTVAIMLFGFLVVGMGLPYLTHYKDADIRSFVYQMISSTVTIFCAVLVTQALFSVLVRLLARHTLSKIDGVLSERAELILGSSVFLVMMALLSVSCWAFRFGKTQLHTAKSLMAHLCAFAGIRAFGHFMDDCPDPDMLNMLSMFCGIVVVLCFLLLAAKRIRPMVLPDRDGATWLAMDEEQNTEEAEPLWIEMAMEAEDEAVVLICSFLVNQLLIFYLTGDVPPLEPQEESLGAEPHKGLCIALLIFFALLVAMTYVRTICTAHGTIFRFTAGLQDLIATSCSWCTLRLGYSLALDFLDGDIALAFVVNAFVMSFLTIPALITVDKIADNLVGKDSKNRARHGEGSEESGAGSSEESDSEWLRGSQQGRPASDLQRLETQETQGSLQARSTGLPYTETQQTEDQFLFGIQKQVVHAGEQVVSNMNSNVAAVHKHLHDVRNQEKALRTIISAFGILVGLSWEQAFEVAEETVISALPTNAAAPTFTRVAVAISIVSFVLPSWMRFIAPMAMLPVHAHQRCIDHETTLEQTDVHDVAVQSLRSELLLKLVPED